MASEDDPDRAAILARRQRFVALALSSLAVACAGRTSRPQVCLSPPMPDSQGEQPPEDAHEDAATDAAATDGETPEDAATDAETPEDPPPESKGKDAAPQVCLMVGIRSRCGR